MSAPARASTGLWSYPAVEGYFDEARTPDGRLRPHWRDLVGAIEAFGPAEAERRWQEGRRLVRENGVTYNVYGDPRGMDRPWDLDPIPLVLTADEWSGIEAAVIQRATLLNQILADVYGPQQLMADGLLPPELVFGHPGFLRPCHGVDVPGGRFLHVYAADLARAPDGRWWVIADRTQAPTGAGYAHENRMVLRRTFPKEFRDSRVRRHAAFFEAFRAMLAALSPRKDHPRVVLLTSGPYNETYFEHSYLARHLGITLVEGGDLVVRDERLFLKTLTGLLQVDVVLRRLDDVFCDPLELFQESTLGVPGLLQAVRAGHVVVANALGSGVTESAAMMAFLETLCPPLLGETLKMPSIATWWCGQDAPRKYVLGNLARLVVKPAFPMGGGEPVFAGELDAGARAALVRRIEANPDRFVAQEQVSLSVAPAWRDRGFAPRHVTLRVHAVATNGKYKVLPGGLTRVSAAADSLVVSMQQGGGSKDTWVLGDDGRDQHIVHRVESRRAGINRGDVALSSRVADNLFWLGRYLERVDFQARLCRSVFTAISDGSTSPASPLPAAACALPALGVSAFDWRVGSGTFEHQVFSAMFDPDRAGNLRDTVASLHRVAWLTRERFSVDAWRVLSRVQADLVNIDARGWLRLPMAIERLDRTVLTISSFAGMVLESMTRGHGWYFLETGRRLERALKAIDLLRHALVPWREDETATLEAVLDIAASGMTYRSRYQAEMHPTLVLDLLLLDETNPRGVAYQLRRIVEYCAQLPRRPGTGLDASFSPGTRPLARVQLADVDELAAHAGNAPRAALATLLDQLRGDLTGLSDTLTRHFLTHAVPLTAM
jgi:uncharacterized circularly permuted ATP-grasp superfamily protein/uncharacterized alpha-E superfamily protein